MNNVVSGCLLAGDTKSVAFELTGKMRFSTLPVRATAVRHNFLGHGLIHGSSDLRFHQHLEADRNALASSQLQHVQSQSSTSDPSTYKVGLNAHARKLTEWMGDSHTRPANSRLAAHGCYRVVGPARISKRGDTLVAHLFRGSRVELLDRHGNATPYGSMQQIAEETDIVASMSQDGAAAGGSSGSSDDSCVAECVLVAAHVELCGSACSVDQVDLSVQSAVHHHNGHTYVSVRSLPPEAVIELDADADLRHPINITPPSA